MNEMSRYSKLHHVSLVVRDADKAIAHYESLGMGPFKQVSVKDTITYRGKLLPRGHFKRREILGQMGAIKLQLVQPGPEDSPWKEFLDAKGEGVHHLCFIVDDIAKEEAYFADKGIDIVLSARFDDGGGACYVDVGKETGGVLLELVEPPKSGMP